MLKTKAEISPMFFAVLTLFLLADRNGTAFPAVMFSFAHEAGHFLALSATKTAPKKVSISLAGISMELSQSMSTKEKIAVLCAGFTVNFCLAVLFFALGKTLFAIINFVIGTFTLLPLASTDGGSIVKEVLEARYPEKAKKAENMLFMCSCVFFSLLIVAAMAATKNFYLLIALFYLVICTIKAKS